MQLTFLSEEAHANHSALPASEPGWMTRAETSCSPILPSLHDIGPSGWSGRMSPEYCHLTGGEILAPSSGRWANSGMGSPTECLTLSTSEAATSPTLFRSTAVVCSLSDILETGDVPQRYYLTPRACAGILRRAEKRGKDLPPMLSQALRQVAGE